MANDLRPARAGTAVQVLCCAALLASACTAAVQRTDPAALRSQVEVTERAFARSMAERDHAAFATFLSEEAVFFSGDTPLRGKQAVAEAWQRYFEGPIAPFSWDPDHVEVLPSGLLAFSTGPVYDRTGKPIARFNSIWRREPSGEWRIVFDRGSPLPASQSEAAQSQAAGEDSTATAERCRGAEYRQFDFWLGRWEVRDTSGAVVGHNRIESAAGGCALLEDWRGARGGRGVSVNTYDPARGKWTQRWVGDGATLWLEGGIEDGRMVLRGSSPRATPRGEVLDRITWSPLADGRVRQMWEVSRDAGATWGAIFNGLYSRVPASP